jgi:hypothetical protein
MESIPENACPRTLQHVASALNPLRRLTGAPHMAQALMSAIEYVPDTDALGADL